MYTTLQAANTVTVNNSVCQKSSRLQINHKKTNWKTFNTNHHHDSLLSSSSLYISDFNLRRTTLRLEQPNSARLSSRKTSILGYFNAIIINYSPRWCFHFAYFSRGPSGQCFDFRCLWTTTFRKQLADRFFVYQWKHGSAECSAQITVNTTQCILINYRQHIKRIKSINLKKYCILICLNTMKKSILKWLNDNIVKLWIMITQWVHSW